jgi:metal-responsive CopG/Arc/MetJ family transcriptional regulator
MAREYKTYAVTLDQETRDLLDGLTERLSLPSRSAILRLAVRELAARHGLGKLGRAGQRQGGVSRGDK